ncbi:MAG: LacI family transcriptional regulator [Opitutaceae bacterium]|jgi:LacI family transcriptional regulator|nr:LacI family transcriptional regulator [Opitutaceae bacterium]
MATSLKNIALLAGVSVATVSRALRGSHLVNEETSLLVKKAALKLDYVRPPLVGAIMSSLRRSAQHSYLGNLALIHIASPGLSEWIPFHKESIKGAQARAAELGFELGVFKHLPVDNRHTLLNRVLRNRGITGLIFINAQARADFSRFNWAPFAAVQIDYPISNPVLHTSGIDHHRTIQMALTRLAANGYRRIGFFIERYKDERLAYKWSGAFAAFQRGMPGLEPIPELERPVVEKADFLGWFKTHRPDVLVGHKTAVIDWLRAEGVRVPRDVGFFNLNWNESEIPCAGLDLEARLQGAVAVEHVVTQIHQFEKGVPAHPKTIYVEGRWVDGPTLLRRKKKRAAPPEAGAK